MAGLEDSWVRVRQGFRPNEVAEAASYCGLFGVVAGGAREWQKTATLVTEEQILQEEEKIRRRYPDRSFATPKLKRMLRYHASKEAHGLRMLRVCTSSTKSCLAFGLISATYVTAEQASQALRGQDDALNSVFAASVLGAAIGSDIAIAGDIAAAGCRIADDAHDPAIMLFALEAMRATGAHMLEPAGDLQLDLLLGHPQGRGTVGLGIQIDEHHSSPPGSKHGGEIDRGGGLSAAALLIHDRDDPHVVACRLGGSGG